VVDAYNNRGIVYEPFQQDLPRVFEQKISAALSQGGEIVEKKTN